MWMRKTFPFCSKIYFLLPLIFSLITCCPAQMLAVIPNFILSMKFILDLGNPTHFSKLQTVRAVSCVSLLPEWFCSIYNLVVCQLKEKEKEIIFCCLGAQYGLKAKINTRMNTQSDHMLSFVKSFVWMLSLSHQESPTLSAEQTPPSVSDPEHTTRNTKKVELLCPQLKR